jgi:hypothetical protein
MAIKQKGAFDLATLDTATPCDTGAEIEILHPVTQEPTGILIKVHGKDSDVFREFSRKAINQRIRQDAIDARRGKPAAIRNLEDIERENVELFAACTISWRTRTGADTYEDSITLNGEKVPFTVANAIRIYSDAKYKTVYDQVNDGIGELGNFIKV